MLRFGVYMGIYLNESVAAEDFEHSCCFTGHRTAAATADEVKKRLVCEIETLITTKGVTYFYAGGALGFDTLAADCVLVLKNKYPFIKLFLALPCKDQHKKWNSMEKSHYEDILQSADMVHYASDEYTEGCMFARNDYMVEHSKYCISFLRRSNGGTFYTVSKAKRLNRELIEI